MKILFAFLVIFSIGLVKPAGAEPLSELLPQLLQDHERIQAAKQRLKAAGYSARGAFAAYLPTVDLTLNGGHENQRKAHAVGTRTGFSEFDIAVKQMLWDFGKTAVDVDNADLSVRQAELGLQQTSQGLIVEAATAYANLIRAYELLRYSQQSFNNVKKQTGVEEFRVRRGSGVASDVLQAKRQMAAANAALVGARGTLITAVNRYRSVFRSEPGDVSTFVRPKFPLNLLPKTLDEALKIAVENSLALRMARVGDDISKNMIKKTRANLYAPSLGLSADSKMKRNVAGTLEDKVELLVKAELTFPLYSGGKDLATYYGSLSTQNAGAQALIETQRSVEEQVRNAWQALLTQRAVAAYRHNEANIAGEFLDIARRERQLNKRTLLEVLSGENAFIGSISQAVSADTDAGLAVYALLSAMGSLDLNAVIGNEAKVPAK